MKKLLAPFLLLILLTACAPQVIPSEAPTEVTPPSPTLTLSPTPTATIARLPPLCRERRFFQSGKWEKIFPGYSQSGRISRDPILYISIPKNHLLIACWCARRLPQLSTVMPS